MADPHEGLEQRVARLEKELALVRLQLHALERASGGDAPQPPEQTASRPGGITPGAGTAPPPPAEPPAVVASVTTEPDEPLGGFAEVVSALPTAGVAAPPVEPPAPPIVAPRTSRVPDRLPTAQLAKPTDGPTLERRIGGQVFAVAGALIIIIGFGLGVKLAIDNHWFDTIPPALRCLGIAALGAAFLGVGEFFRTRIAPLAVAGCNAVGIAALYIAAYSAFHFFQLIASPVAFTLMALSAVIGLGAALRHGFLSTGLLSLLGAYLVPILLAEPDASPYILPVYLLLLSAVSLTLAAARPRPFGPMRDAAWLGSGLLGLIWTFATLPDHPWLVLAFWATGWVLHQAELLITASRNQLRPAAPPTDPRRTRRYTIPGRSVEPVLLAIATTGGVIALIAIILEHHLGLEPWLASAAGMLATGAVALVFGGHLRVLRDKPRTDLETLAAAHAAQAGALMVVTVALALEGWVEATAWLAMGVAAVLAGRWIAARSLEVYGVVLLTIATARIATYDLFVGSAGVPWTVDAPLVLAPWTILILAAGAAWILVARLMLHTSRDEEGDPAGAPRPTVSLICAVIAVGAWMYAPAHPESSAAAVCVAWLVLSILLRTASRFEPRLHLGEISIVVAGASIFPWLTAAEFEGWLRSTVAVCSHPGLWLSAAVSAVLVGHALVSRRRGEHIDQGPVWPVLLSLAGGVMLVATSVEVARSAAMFADDLTARRAAVSIWWGLWGVSLVVGGFWKRTAPVRYVGLALMSVAAVKAVLLDLAGVPQTWRVASFVGLGALMLGVAILYSRVSASLSNSPEPDPPELE